MAARKEFWNLEKPSDSSHYGTVKQTMSVAPHIAINLFFSNFLTKWLFNIHNQIPARKYFLSKLFKMCMPIFLETFILIIVWRYLLSEGDILQNIFFYFSF